MPTEVTMPKLGLNMTEGRLLRWLAEDGAQVHRGQPIFELETEKVDAVADAPADGILRTLVRSGEVIPVAGLVGYVLAPGEELPTFPAAPPRPIEPAPAPARTGPAAAVREGEVRASPAARRRAEDLGIDITQVKGSGADGRIGVADVETFARMRTEQIESPEPQRIPITGVRAVIAERMLASAQQTAAVTLTTEVDATALERARAELNERPGRGSGAGVSFNDIVILAVARALRACPYMNARQEGNTIRLLAEVNIALAVDTDRGLLAPVVHHADRLSLPEISRDVTAKVDRATRGTILPDELSGATFTVTNLGMYEIDAFTPIINPPQLAILGVGRISQRPAVVHGDVQVRDRMVLSLTFDHRLVDGGPAARFLQRVKALIEGLSAQDLVPG